MDDDTDEKSNPKRTPLLPGFQLKEPDPDVSLAMPLEEQQEGDSSPCPTVESESKDNDDDDDDDYEFNTEDYEFFSSWGIDEDFGLLGGLDSSSYFVMEEGEVDPDELSYEQLVELGEIIGEAKRGLSTEQISSCLHPFMYKPVDPIAGIDRCIICQVEYQEEGEELAALPCEHPYHPECIGRWLHVKKSCPICNAQVSTI